MMNLKSFTMKMLLQHVEIKFGYLFCAFTERSGTMRKAAAYSLRVLVAAVVFAVIAVPSEARTKSPRIINIVNFVRQNDYRLQDSENLLYDATNRELALVNKYNFPATFLLQYDALIDSRYKALFLSNKRANIEIGAWWEITQPHVEAAGLKWRGAHAWVSNADVGFATGYTKAEREKLVDVYMQKFREIYGTYPKSVGSWYIDAYTLGYMSSKYHIVASCICKDQIGTDGYTLWGGYWNQAYYPSKVNAYMPAQTEAGQIPVPVFRMLGSDPIYQYGCTIGGGAQGVITLEPVYGSAGGDKKWVEYFFNSIVSQPCLAFNYAQVGQENSFTWNSIGKGLEMQMSIIAGMNDSGKIDMMTLEQAGRWFTGKFKTTPPTAVTVENDFRHEGRKTVWYDSKYYRANVLLDADSSIGFRDIHLFNEKMKSDYYDKPGTTSHFTFETLPVVDGLQWSSDAVLAGMRIVKVNPDGSSTLVKVVRTEIKERGAKSMSVKCYGKNAGEMFTMLLDEDAITVNSPCREAWALELRTGRSDLPFVSITDHLLRASFNGFSYIVRAEKGKFEKPANAENVVFRIVPDGGVKLYMRGLG